MKVLIVEDNQAMRRMIRRMVVVVAEEISECSEDETENGKKSDEFTSGDGGDAFAIGRGKAIRARSRGGDNLHGDEHQ